MAGTSTRLYQTTPAAGTQPPHPCDKDERFDKLNEKLDKIVGMLAEGNTQFATLHLRVRALEVVVYGGCALALIYLVNQLLTHSSGRAG